MEVDMNGNRRGRGWIVATGAILLTAVVGIVAYNFGVSEGLAHAGNADAFVGRHRPWIGGLGFLFPLFFVFLWMGLFRALWWGGSGGPWGWRRHYYYPDGPYGPDPWHRRFDEWHRRAHEEMKETPSADKS